MLEPPPGGFFISGTPFFPFNRNSAAPGHSLRFGVLASAPVAGRLDSKHRVQLVPDVPRDDPLKISGTADKLSHAVTDARRK